MGPADNPEYASEKRKALQAMREAEESAAASEKEDAALRKLQATKEKDWQLSTRNVQVKVAENRERISGAAAAAREAQAIRRLADETARYRDQIEDAADEVGILTKKQIEMAKLAGVKMDKPGGNLDKMEAAVDKQNKLLKKVVDPGFHSKTGEWVKTSVQQYADVGIKNLDRLDKALTKTKRIFEEGRGSRVKPRYASEDPTLPGYEHPENLYGRNPADMGVYTDALSKAAYEAKMAHPILPGSKIPQGRSMDDRMKLFVDDIGTRFKVASQLAKEMFVSGDKAMELRLRAISDQYFGTDTQKPWEKAWNEDYFNPLTTIPESGFENLGINPSLLARAGGQVGRAKKQDYSRAHPIHAMHMLKKLLGDIGEPAGALMPAEAIDQAYQEIVGDVPYKGTNVKPDKRYLKTVDPVVNAVVKRHVGDLKTEIDQMIGKFQAVHTTLTGEARGSALSEIWTKIKAVQRAEGSDWTKARRDLMLELNPPKPNPYDDPELGNRMSEMFGRPNIPAGASIDPAPWTGGSANQEAIAKVFGPAIRKKVEIINTAVAEAVTKSAAKPSNIAGLLQAGHVQETVERMGQVREAIQNQFQYVEDAYDQVASVPQDVVNKALGGKSAGSYGQHAAEVAKNAARVAEQVASRQAENMAYLKEIAPLATQARTNLAQEAKHTADLVGRINPSNKGIYDSDIWMKKINQHKAITMAESAIGFKESSADEGRSQNQIAAEWARHWAQVLPPTHKLGEIIDKATSGGLVAVPQKVIEDYITRLRVKYDKEQTRLGIPGYQQASSIPTAEELMGQKVKFNITSNSRESREKALALIQSVPGFQESNQTDSYQSSIPGTGSKYGAVTRGTVGDLNHAKQLRGIFEQIALLPGIDNDKTGVELSTRKLSIGQRLLENSQKLRFVNKSLVQSQMAMLGVFFSMMSVTNLLGQAWGKIGQSVGNLEGMFKSIGEALAFGRKGTKSYELVQNMLKDTKNLVGAWKNYTGVMGLFSSMMTVIAYKLFTDVRIIDKIYEIMDKMATMISEPGFMENIIILFESLIKAIPEIINGVNWLVGLFGKLAGMPGMDKILGFMVGAGLAAAVAMPALAIFGAAFEGLYLTAKGLGTLLESSAGAKIMALFGGSSGQATLGEFGLGAESIGTISAAGALAIGGLALAAIYLFKKAWDENIGGFADWISEWIAKGDPQKIADDIVGALKLAFGLLVLTDDVFGKVWKALYEEKPSDADAILKKFSDTIRIDVTKAVSEAHIGGLIYDTLFGFVGDSKTWDELGSNFSKGINTAIAAAFKTWTVGFYSFGNSLVDALMNGFWDKWYSSDLAKLVYGESRITQYNAGRAQARASGGSIFAGQTYLVGERGPELFTSGRSGTITPNNQLGGGGDIYITNNIGTVNSVANLRDVLDAANMSAKYSYSGG